MYCYRDNKKYKSDLVVLADMYLQNTIVNMSCGIVGGSRFGIKEVLEGIGFDINKCLLMDIPICLKHKECLTHYTVEDSYKKYSCSDFYDCVIGSHYYQINSLRDNYKGFDKIGNYKFSFLGALEIAFMDTENFVSYKLLIDMYSGYALLCDRDIVKVYGINRRLLNSNIALKYREMGIEDIPNVFLMACWGSNPRIDNGLIDVEWEKYNSNFDTVFDKLDKSEFVRVFKKNVKGYRKN